MEGKSLAGDFTSGSILVKLVKFMLPVLGALVLQAMYGAVDLIVVGNFGTDEGIAAVSIGSNIVNIVMFMIAAFTMGVTVIIGRCLGERENEKIGSVIGGAIAFFTVITVAFMVILTVLAGNFAELLNAPEQAYEHTVNYVRICGVGIVFVVAYNFISGIFRGLGNSKLPLMFVAIACVVNIVGDLVFVAGFGLNVVGAALATILAQAVSVVLSLIIIKRQKLPFTFSKKDIGFNSQIKDILKVGFPLALQDVLVNSSFLILMAIINSLGYEQSSGYGIAQKVVQFVMLIPGALMQSMSAFVAQNVGAGLEKRSRKAMTTGMLLGAAIGVFIMILAFFKGDLLARPFTDNEAFIAQAADYLRGFSSEAILTCIVFSFIGYFNGHENSFPVMLQGITSSFLLRVPLSYLFSLSAGVTLTEIGLAVPITSIYGIIFFGVWYIAYTKKLKSKNRLN